MAENADSGPRPVPPAERPGLARPADRHALRRRILSALVLVPMALAAVWFGTLAVTPLVACAAGMMAWEWGRLIGRMRTALDAALFVGTAIAAVLGAGFVSVTVGGLIALAGVAGLVLLGRKQRPGWTALGMVWVIVPSIGFVWLRADPVSGLQTALWLLALVWATDSAAYAAGRSLGGPKLAGRISPNKTWSGLLGGIAAAMLVGLGVGWLHETSPAWKITVLSGGLAVVEQIGDIAESYAKRRFGAKDSGSLIPGHGGVLDRLDGMLAVVGAVMLLTIFAGGSIFSWR
jgi:phosphatidate cytidylyltransferase